MKQRNPLKSFRVVGQTSGSLNLRKAALPLMIHVSSEKTFEVSCEESLTSFYTSLKFLFLLSVSHKTYKTSFTSFTSTIEQKKPADTTQQADTLSQKSNPINQSFRSAKIGIHNIKQFVPVFRTPLLGNGNWNDESCKSRENKHAIEARTAGCEEVTFIKRQPEKSVFQVVQQNKHATEAGTANCKQVTFD